MWHLKTGFTGEHGGDARLMVGLCDLKDLFQPELFHDFVPLHEILCSNNIDSSVCALFPNTL